MDEDFEYDPPKAATNLKKHGVSLADAEGVFQDPFARHIEDLEAEGEQRFIALGEGSAGALLVVVYTHRGEKIRVISARRATPQEVRKYREDENNEG
jgi:uncharacterized protein